ncbi:MAG TPA: 4-(cytidine 5'-diphospho)-2-C-methyl-D-erythritol kinase [Chryseosolibacter sp.]
MVSFPPCKINLGLHITRKRPDGYHDLVTCFYPVPWCDVLEAVPAPSFAFSSSGLSIPGVPQQNLCVRAYEMLRAAYGIGPVSMHLLKIVPIGAGLGGGSSDGAFALRMLNRLFELGLSTAELKAFASRLGSDCAFFTGDAPMIATGRGDVLSPVSLTLKGKYAVIVKPEMRIETSAAYALIKPREPGADLRQIVEKEPVARWRDILRNDFEEPVFREFPLLKEIRLQLYEEGALYACMSGSGSALYGLFEKEVDLKKTFGHMTCWSGFLD